MREWRRAVRAGLWMLLVLAAGPAPAPAGPLQADELLLLYSTADPASRDLAEYYAVARKVPADRLLGLTVRARGEEVAPAEYEASIREPVRAFIEKRGLQEKVRCLVVFYGLPLRVDAMAVSPARRELLARWREEFGAALDEYEAIIARLDPAATRPAARPRAKETLEDRYRSALERYQRARAAAVNSLRTGASPGDAQARFQQIMEVIQKIEGNASLLAQLEANVRSPSAGDQAGIASLRESVGRAENRIRELIARGIDDPGRDEARKLLREAHGLAGLLTSLEADINQVRPEETQGSVDSELALLWWEGYPKYRWVTNTQSWRARAELAKRGVELASRNPPVLLVSRIDGPTPELARGLIDKAMAAERDGPQGIVYLDARGLARQKEGYGAYDQYLRDLAAVLRLKTQLRVRLDNKPDVYRAGQCPETMLYCGWYSVRKYVDAFTFVGGAVGYHLASFEAVSLKARTEKGWCKGLIEDGITATLGPVAEPYLQAFPRPDDFFGLLLTGEFTLAEVYGYTLPFHSWMMVLIGDPLYRPFARQPVMALDQAMAAELIPAEFRTATRPATRPE